MPRVPPIPSRTEAAVHDSNSWKAQGSLSHYTEPSYYDKCYANRHHDIAFYETQTASAQTILEYGCGNGRIALPLARRGAHVTGVDLSIPMLESFRERLGREPKPVRDRITLVHGDMRKKRLKRRFEVVLCTFNTFLHLYDRGDVEQFLACVRNHLEPEGKFIMDTSLPLIEELARNPGRPYRVPRLKYPPTGQVVRYAEYFDYDPMSQVMRVTMRFEPFDDPKAAWSVLLAHRQFQPQEIEALFHYNGFQVLSVHPNLDDGTTPLDSLGWVARVRR